MSTSSLAARLASFKTKTAELIVQEVKVPDTSTDVLSLFELNTAARADSSNEWIIDLFPNMTEIVIYVMLMSLQHSRVTEHREHSKSSVATIAMYHMSIVYGFFLLNDLHVRPSPSAHARSWSQTSWKHEFANFLINLPVPEFLVPILNQLTACQTDRTRNIFVIPSAAGYDHDTFFGRSYPLSFFAEIHDCTATLPGNTPRIQVLNDIYSRVLYSITAPAFECLIPDLLGVTIDQAVVTTANHVNSKLYQVFTAVFNPVIFRDFQRRTTLATLSFRPPVFATPDLNAYDCLFSATSANLRELRIVLQAVSTILKDHVVCKQTLGQFISSASGINALKHGYSTYALPTWSHSTNANKPALYRAITVTQNQTFDVRAADISFLQRPAAAFNTPTPVVSTILALIAAPFVPVPLPANHQLTNFWPWNLRITANPVPLVPFPRHDNTDLVQFDDAIHTTPRVLVLDTDGTKTVTAHLATLTGKIIESFEIDGCTIEHPDTRKSLGLQNSMFADSAIPYRLVRRGRSFRPRPPATVLAPLDRRPANSTQRLPASTLLYDRTTIMLPRTTENVHDAVLPPTLPGMTLRDNTTFLRYVQSFLGFRTVDATNNAANLDAVPATANGRLLLWSPYSYTPFESDDEPLPVIADSRHYFITNFRSMFGTEYNLVELKHPFEALPVV
jgi:hypothetical protein